ncbi:unnamed protein product [Orchesella dallaii]|uniref:Uncharacterized protein n=1 Tax=Orchesella dallaii TaxID=48710 RepID=A0ABP1QKJ0_9HEXA
MGDIQMFNGLLHCSLFQTDCFNCVINGCYFGLNAQKSYCSEDLQTLGGGDGIVFIIPPLEHHYCYSIETTTPEVESFNDFHSSNTTSHSYDWGIIMGIIAFLAIILVCLIWLCIIFKRRVSNSVPFV